MADVTSPFGFPYPESTDLVRDGATDIEALAQAANDQFSAGFQFAGQRIFTSSGVFAKADPLGTGDIGLRAVRVRMVGGGGSGTGLAGTSDDAKAGGGSGGFSEKFYGPADIASFDASETVIRGAGAAGVVNGNGATGGESSLRSQTAGGGGGSAQNRGRGGEGDGGDLNFGGNNGNYFIVLGGGFGQQLSGFGGASIFGGSDNGIFPSSNESVAGRNGLSPGAGGGGAASRGNSGTAQAGGAGANGIVIIDCFV